MFPLRYLQRLHDRGNCREFHCRDVAVTIKKGAVIKNCVVLADCTIGENVHIENLVVDKHAKITHAKEIISPAGEPGYIKRNDTL